MDETVNDLVLAPFRDIVEQGNIAVGNASDGGNEAMLKAAQSLVKEGERALKRIEPLCRRKCEEFGFVFVNALKDDDGISRFVQELNDLLYDFEEYVEVNSFDVEKFTGLQALSRKAAPAISHTITRMKLELPRAGDDAESTHSRISSDPMAPVRRSMDDVSSQRASLPYPVAEDPSEHPGTYAMPYPSGPEHNSETRLPEPSPSLLLSTVQEEEPLPPPPPLLDPWSSPSRTPDGMSDSMGHPWRVSSDSAIGSDAGSEHGNSPITANSQHLHPQQLNVAHSRPNRISTSSSSPGSSPDPNTTNINRPFFPGRISPTSPHRDQRDSVSSQANASVRSSVSDHRIDRSFTLDTVSPISPTTQNRASVFSVGAFQDQPRGQEQSPHVAPLVVRPRPSVSVSTADNGGLETVQLPTLGVPDGLIPVDEETVEQRMPSPTPETQFGGCAINLNSSYYQFRGFCSGAMEVIQGGIGVKHIKRQECRVSRPAMSRWQSARHVLSSLTGKPWRETRIKKASHGNPLLSHPHPPPPPGVVQRESQVPNYLNTATENFKSSGVGFRLRFLLKSHIHAKNVGDQIYGCAFCVQLRQTTHPNDATVFFSQRQLFAHLARHPRPLPEVPGLLVLQTEDVPVQFANNYDLHFPGPARVSMLADMMRELTALPTGTAVQTCRHTPTSNPKRPPDGSDVLSLAAGARILGVEFPAKYQGDWCLGWADHEQGLLPADIVRLDPPPGRKSGDSANQGGSTTLRGVARWRFAVKDGKDKSRGEWLSFGKGEVITNIGWSHADHWCWWGTNAKGRSGMFPQSHIEPGTLKEAAAAAAAAAATATTVRSDRASTSSGERKTGLLARISIRQKSGGSGGGGGGMSSSWASMH
ncbi:hypothetical protein M406DRAFT_69825 [Cryphonectria parasitica EP155]|uniref:SH3 domain-containing protein n=1 Tax=Cryphonectria parasitica (strain ATCC 38755 / EP155) TaxID=660469 RepID=A0A9P5CS23_CRYP1|nr:uncharacterized protein M406DRAFT_69825 [Cryphonectria parasitica EP155]KAF3767705.1 hypothetical protein M406DRAFT_69825 [Cryphonectria parasitica EP155]